MAKIKIIKHHAYYPIDSVHDVDEARANYLIRVGVAVQHDGKEKVSKEDNSKEKKDIQKAAEKRRIKKPGSY